MPIYGVKEANYNINLYNQAHLNASGDASVELVNDVKELAQGKAPKKTGQLKDSAFANVHYIKTRKTTLASVGFRAPYALIVHENHPTHRKFLQRAWDEMYLVAGKIFKRHSKQAQRKLKPRLKKPRRRVT